MKFFRKPNGDHIGMCLFNGTKRYWFVEERADDRTRGTFKLIRRLKFKRKKDAKQYLDAQLNEDNDHETDR